MTTTLPEKTRKRNRKKTRERERRILRERKRRILDRLRNRPGPERDHPMMTAANIHYELADRVQGLLAVLKHEIHHLVKEVRAAGVRKSLGVAFWLKAQSAPGGAPLVFRTERIQRNWDWPSWWPFARAKARG